MRELPTFTPKPTASLIGGCSIRHCASPAAISTRQPSSLGSPGRRFAIASASLASTSRAQSKATRTTSTRDELALFQPSWLIADLSAETHVAPDDSILHLAGLLWLRRRPRLCSAVPRRVHGERRRTRRAAAARPP